MKTPYSRDNKVGRGWASHAALAVTFLGLLAAFSPHYLPWRERSGVATDHGAPAAGTVPAAAAPTWKEKSLATGLKSPDGLALDEATGDIYVTEEDKGRVVVVHPDGSVNVLVDPETPIYRRDGPGLPLRVEALSSPEGLVVHNDTLYVVEDKAGGRLITFALHPGDQHKPVTGEVVPLPPDTSGYAWESVDVGRGGEILMAGSGLEGALQQGGIASYFGALLLRDTAGTWWMPLRTFMGGYSSARFAPDMKTAVFTSETLGEVGCLDLTSYETRLTFGNGSVDSPENVSMLPDGSALVASEGGTLYRYQPSSGSLSPFHDLQTGVESVLWDERGHRLLATCDGTGQLVSVEPSLAPFHSALEWAQPVTFASGGITVPVPETCPDYLDGVLRMGGYDARRSKTSFREFARRVSLFAVDAVATPVDCPSHPERPFNRVQFMVMYPDFFGLEVGALFGPASGFVAVNTSNEIIRTRLMPRETVAVDTWSVEFNPLGKQKVAIPAPLGCHLSPQGVASIHFIGAGETPDFHIVINTRNPDNSYMMVSQLGKTGDIYALSLPQGKQAGHWVAAMPRDEPEMWRPLAANTVASF